MIKLIASDIDGTFLRSDRTFDEELFKKVHQKMLDNDIQFVIASGNQYDLLRSLFPDYDDIIYVSENGANIRDINQTYYIHYFDNQIVKEVVDTIKSIPDSNFLVCSDTTAYSLPGTSAEYLEDSKKYYDNIKHVDSLDAINESILKFSISCLPDDTQKVMTTITDAHGNNAIPTSSGHGDIDIIQPNMHKAAALKILGDKLEIELDEMCAFGDGGNDLEMLREVGLGVSMGNAYPDITAIANDHTGTNDEQGVLTYIDNLLD